MRGDLELREHGADLRAAAMNDDRIDAGLLHQHDVLRKIVGGIAAGHGVAAILHDDGFLIVLEDVGQCFHEHACGRAPACQNAQIAILADIILQSHVSPSRAEAAPYNPKLRKAKTPASLWSWNLPLPCGEVEIAQRFRCGAPPTNPYPKNLYAALRDFSTSPQGRGRVYVAITI